MRGETREAREAREGRRRGRRGEGRREGGEPEGGEGGNDARKAREDDARLSPAWVRQGKVSIKTLKTYLDAIIRSWK
jgi:hypothetical protein